MYPYVGRSGYFLNGLCPRASNVSLFALASAFALLFGLCAHIGDTEMRGVCEREARVSNIQNNTRQYKAKATKYREVQNKYKTIQGNTRQYKAVQGSTDWAPGKEATGSRGTDQEKRSITNFKC